MKEHFCDRHPDGSGWYPGPVQGCDYHDNYSGAKQWGYREGRISRAKKDREAGVVGVDRGSHISGTNL